MGYYALLLAVSFWLNRDNLRMLLLTLFVGCGIFFPIPDEDFYWFCIAVEIIVLTSSEMINARASNFISGISLWLICVHGLGLVFDGYPPYSPYHFLVKFSEYLEIIVCILASTQAIYIFRNARILLRKLRWPHSKTMVTVAAVFASMQLLIWVTS